jgi:diguanylate cyclase (GGDEF)-like protein
MTDLTTDIVPFQVRDPADDHDCGSNTYTPQPCADSATGLPNRAMLNWYLEHLFALSPHPPLNSALLVIALTGVKAMRYAFGDSICNQFTHIVAERLRAEAKPGQFVAALGDDEFAFVLSKSGGREECIALAKTLLARISDSIRIEGRVYFSAANIGIAVADVEMETPADMLLRAQTVLQQARLDGAGAIRFADSNSARLAVEELALLNDVHDARQRGEFTLHYQPVIDLRTREIVGLEALFRWNSPRFGPVAPQRCMPLLEKYGGILEVGEWVLRDACSQARIWNQDSAKLLRVSVNVSAIQLETEDFETRLVTILAETRCRPEWIELEITESTAVQVMSGVKERLLSIANRGITIAIDDFGAGYSSFGNLAKLPAHHLKLDRALIANSSHDHKGLAIVRAIQLLATTLGLTLTVKGIERHDQRLFCEQAGLVQGQGFLLGMPVPAAEISAKLEVTTFASAIAA